MEKTTSGSERVGKGSSNLKSPAYTPKGDPKQSSQEMSTKKK